MRYARSILASLLLAIGAMGVVAATPAQADAYHYRWMGYSNYPYYWNNYTYNPYSAYSPYTNWYGTYGGYYGNYPYYSSYRAYPWGWYY